MSGTTETRRLDAGTFLGIVNQGNVGGNLFQNFSFQDRRTVAVTLPAEQELPSKDEFLKLLSWRTPLASLVGRNAELSDLKEWTNEGGQVRVRLLSGPGGSGKSRLAFELARALKSTGQWTAGFVQGDEDGDIEHGNRHLLVILDYAEQYRPQVLRFLKALAELPASGNRVRVLLLSRYSLDWWRRNIDAPSIHAVLDGKDCEVSRLSTGDATQCFNDVTRVLGTHFKKNVTQVTPDQIASWIADNEELHPLPLFVTAAGIEAVLSPETLLKLSGRQLLQALATRERLRIDLIGNRVRETRWASRLTALGLLTGGISLDVAKRLATDEPSLLLPGPNEIEGALNALPNMRNGVLQPIAPDLVGAQFLADAIETDDFGSPSSILGVMRPANSSVAERLARVAYDARSLSEADKNPVALLLEGAVANDLPSARLFAEVMQNARPTDLLPALLAASRLMVTVQEEPSLDRFRVIARYSAQLQDSGEFDQALGVAEQTIQITEQLRAKGLDPDLRHFANALNNRSNLLARARRGDEALRDIEETVRIRRKLVEDNPVEFLPQLASSLQNLAMRRTEVGDQTGADEAIGEALKIYRDLSAEDPERHARELARTMHNLGIRLHEIGDRRGSIAAFKEAADRRTELVRATPTLDELDLTYSLHSLAQRLLDVGEFDQALDLAHKVLGYREKLLKFNAKRVGLDLLYTLQLISAIQLENGQLSDAIKTAKDSVAKALELARDYPGEFDAGLGFTQVNLAWRHLDNGSPDIALETIDQAKSILERLTERDPARYEAELANCLTARGRILRDVGDLAEAIKETQAAVGIRRRLATANPVRYSAELGGALRQLSWLQNTSGALEDGFATAAECVSLLRLLSHQFPLRFEQELAVALTDFSWRLWLRGREQEALQCSFEAVQLLEKHAHIAPSRINPALAAALRACAQRQSDLAAQMEALSSIDRAYGLLLDLPAGVQRRRETERFDCLVVLGAIKIDNDKVDDALGIAQTIVESRKSAATSPRYDIDLANAYLEAARIQRRAGQLEKALQTALEGETIFRRLARNEPRRHGPDLCRSLRIVADIANEAGHTKRALSSLQECIQNATPFWVAEPTRYVLDQAHDHLSLSRRLRSVPRIHDAREAVEKAVALFREAVKLNPERQLEQLGWALNFLSCCEMDCRLCERALSSQAEALHCMHVHVRRFPYKGLRPIIVVLKNAAWLHASMKQRKKALVIAELVVRIARRFCIATSSPSSEEELAHALVDLSNRRREANDQEAALSSIQEAVGAWRRLAALSHIHLLDLAGSIETLASIEGRQNKIAALRAREEACRVYEEASQHVPIAAEPKLAANLLGISDLVSDPKHALDTLTGAIRLFEYHAPQSYLALRRLPDSLGRKEELLRKHRIVLGQVVILRRAVRSLELRMDEQVDGTIGSLVETLEHLALAFREMGQLKNATAAIEQARLLVDPLTDWFDEAQVRRISRFDRSALSLRELLRRRLWVPCQSIWRALRIFGATRVGRALS